MPLDDVARPPTLPPELLAFIIELILESTDAATSPALFSAIAPFTLASTQFRSLTLHRFLRHIILLETYSGNGTSQWTGFFRLLDALEETTGGDCFTWVRSLTATSKTLMGPFHSARLAALTHLEKLVVDFATEGLTTQKLALKLIAQASRKLTNLTLTSLPRIDIPLLRLIADTFPCLVDLHLSCTERLDFHCWNCYEESLGCTTHSPVPGMFYDTRDMAIIFAKNLKPLKCLTRLHLGIYLSDEMLIQYHIDHAEDDAQPFGPEQCLLCEGAANQVRLRELTAALELAQSLKALTAIGFSSFFDDSGGYHSNSRNAGGWLNETTVYVLRKNGRLKVRKTPWSNVV